VDQKADEFLADAAIHAKNRVLAPLSTLRGGVKNKTAADQSLEHLRGLLAKFKKDADKAGYNYFVVAHGDDPSLGAETSSIRGQPRSIIRKHKKVHSAFSKSVGAQHVNWGVKKTAEKKPYRHRAEVYIHDGKGNVLANQTDSGWQFPAGGIEGKATPEQTAKREVLEEAGYRIANPRPFGAKPAPAKWPEWYRDIARAKGRDNFAGQVTHMLVAELGKKDKRHFNREGDGLHSLRLVPLRQVIADHEKIIQDPKHSHYVFRKATLPGLKKLHKQLSNGVIDPKHSRLPPKTKTAVDVVGLTKAWKAAVDNGRLVRLPKTVGVVTRNVGGKNSTHADTAIATILAGRLRGVVSGNRGRGADPATRRLINLAVGRHEIVEAGKHPGVLPHMELGDAFPLYAGGGSHLSLKPVLNDLNVAATLSGDGSAGASDVLRAKRAYELFQLNKVVPEMARLDLGEKRIGRGTLKHLQRIYDKRVIGASDYASLPPSFRNEFIAGGVADTRIGRISGNSAERRNRKYDRKRYERLARIGRSIREDMFGDNTPGVVGQ
jgi:8-oxo-dGTP pyrophosphatase MutT (NUDIX family)